MLTSNQKQLLKQLDNVVIKLFGECEDDADFNNYLGGLEIFKTDLLETSCIINDELE